MKKVLKIKFKRVFPFSTSKYLVIKLKNIKKIKVLISKNDKFFLEQKENYEKIMKIYKKGGYNGRK